MRVLIFKAAKDLCSQTSCIMLFRPCVCCSLPPSPFFIPAPLIITTTLSLQASLIYEGTPFNLEGSPIHFGIERIVVESEPPLAEDPFANNFLGVQSFLDLHSRGDFSQFCLSYRFTNRDFDNGVVGLAYIGQALGSNAAGLCVCTNFKVSCAVSSTFTMSRW